MFLLSKGYTYEKMMPPKKAAKSTTKRDVCDAAIVEGKEDALQCEDACQMWYHHYYAGVSRSHFRRLASTSNPFVCLSCSQDVHQTVVCQLQLEITALKNEVRALLDAKNVLSEEIYMLKASVATLHTQVESAKAEAQCATMRAGTATTTSIKQSTSWVTVVRNGHNCFHRQATGDVRPNPTLEAQASCNKVGSSKG